MKYTFGNNHLISFRLKKISVLLFLLGNLFYTLPVPAQSCLDVIKSNTLYSTSYDIINGRKWDNETRYNGSPLLESYEWPKADILYNGVHYRDVNMNYDVFKEELIVYSPEKGQEKYVLINKAHLSGFSFTDILLQRDRLFEYTELAGISGKALYEKIPVHKVSFFVRPMIKFDATPSESTLGKYTSYSLYYIDSGKGFTDFRSKSQLTKLLVNHRTEVNRFIRKQKLKINNKHPEDVVTAIRYFDGLN
jgi:hypothetical protein